MHRSHTLDTFSCESDLIGREIRFNVGAPFLNSVKAGSYLVDNGFAIVTSGFPFMWTAHFDTVGQNPAVGRRRVPFSIEFHPSQLVGSGCCPFSESRDRRLTFLRAGRCLVFAGLPICLD